MNSDQKRRAEQLTSVFENDKIELQYGYADEIHDGRGITSGRAGFTTRTGDALAVIELYTQQKPDNGLAGFLPELRRLAADRSQDTSHLQGYIEAWMKAAAADPVFCSVQDQIVDEMYYRPSVDYSEKAGLRTALAQAVIYDTIIQHGDGADPDGLPELLLRASRAAGGTPGTGVDEKAWLIAFLKIRRQVLASAYDCETREEWAKSVDRVDFFWTLADSGNDDLNGPIEVRSKNHCATVP